jgi:phospho-2-dehydro-3-deoxyheptonate aldolase
MEYGVSVTDACIDLETTKALLVEADSMLNEVLKKRV